MGYQNILLTVSLDDTVVTSGTRQPNAFRKIFSHEQPFTQRRLGSSNLALNSQPYRNRTGWFN